jgi:trigger factor
VENGDRIILDYCGKVDGVAFDGGTAEDQTLEIGSHTFIPGFEEQLIGAVAGEERDINVTFPEEYHAENLKGKAAVFTCKVKTVQKKELPEIDDEFIKDISEQDTVAEWKENKKQELLKAREAAAKNARENELLEKAADNAQVDIPDCMVDREVQYMMQNMASMMNKFPGGMAPEKAAPGQAEGFRLGNMEIPPEMLGTLLSMDMSPENLEKLQKLLDIVLEAMPKTKDSNAGEE